MAAFAPNIGQTPPLDIQSYEFQVWASEEWEQYLAAQNPEHSIDQQMATREIAVIPSVREPQEASHETQDRVEDRINTFVHAPSIKRGGLKTSSRSADPVRMITPRFFCPFKGCRTSYLDRITLNAHCASVHRTGLPEKRKLPAKEEMPFPCPHAHCALGFQRTTYLRAHRINEHGDVVEVRKIRKVPEEQKNFVCQTCQHRLATRDGLKWHMKNKH